MEAKKRDLSELMTNQKHMLVAIKYLNEQIEDILEKAKNDNKKEVENILESQAMIDKIIVKNSDDILMIKNAKEENSMAIRQLERQIYKVDKEIEMTKKAVQSKTDIIQRWFQSNNPDSSMDCKLCEKSFNKFVDLENHIKMCLEKHSILKCDQCDKGFVLR